METEKVVVFQFKLKKKDRLPALAFALLCLCPLTLGSETLTLTTYYPAPYGAYVAMLTTNQTLLARDGGKVGIGTKNPKAKLDVTSTTDGFLPPRMTQLQRDDMSNSWSPAQKTDKLGMTIYNTGSKGLESWDGENWVGGSAKTGYLGKTAATYTGNLGGYSGAAALCSNQFGAGARMCTGKEYLDFNGIDNGWVSGYVVWGPTYAYACLAPGTYCGADVGTSYNANCADWNHSVGNYGLVGITGVSPCSTLHSILCCR